MNSKGENHKHLFDFANNNIAPAKGRVLVAEPFLHGKYFARSVILLIEHHEKGSMGLVLNKPLLLHVNEMVDLLPTCKTPLFLGGPVSTDHLFYIHTLGNLIPQSYPLAENLFWGGDLQVLESLLKENIATPQQVRFFTGYAGWSKEQLEEEIQEKSWVVSLLSTEILLNTATETLWDVAVSQLGKDFSHWLHFPKNPLLN